MEKEEETIEITEILNVIKKVYNRLTIKDLIIIILMLFLFFLYVLHTRDIEKCNAYYLELLRNTTYIMKSFI